MRNFNTLKNGAGTSTVPLFWMWEFLLDPNYGWTAASYLSAFFLNIMVAFFELIAWFFYIGGRPNWLVWWTGNIGWWFSTMGLVLPWLFAIFQLAFNEEQGGLSMDIYEEGGYNAVFLLAGNLFQWMNAAMTHLFLGNRFECHVKALEPVRKRTVYKKCPVKRTFGQTDREYQAACKEYFANNAGAAEGAADAAFEEEEDL